MSEEGLDQGVLALGADCYAYEWSRDGCRSPAPYLPLDLARPVAFRKWRKGLLELP
jgi:hypothetical protein